MISKILKKVFKGDSIEKVSVATKENIKQKKSITPSRIGELGEYKINIQLDQLPKNSKYLCDLLIPNAKSGYSQIDHVTVSVYHLITENLT